MRLYPDPTADLLVSELADFYHLDKDQIFVGVGSDDVLAMCFLTFFNSERPIFFPDITYSFYDVWADVFRIPYECQPLDENFRIVKEDYYRANGGVIFPNPNAPTGIAQDLSDIEDILQHNQDVVVIVDEAYIDFGGHSALELIDRYEISIYAAKTLMSYKLHESMEPGTVAQARRPELEAALKSARDKAAAAGCTLNDRFEYEKDGKPVTAVRKLTPEEIDLSVRRVARIVKIGMFMDRYPSELSGGQQQRVAIARTLAPEPTVLFMDEPLSNLDAKLRLEMRSELQRLHIDTGSTFIYVTHDQMEAMTLATKICLIENGVLQQYDAPLDVYAKPNNVFVADFVGNPAINFIDASGAQQSDGTLTLSALDGMQLSFRPKEPLDVAAWYERADAEDKARRDAENARALDKKSVEKGNKDVLFRYHVARVNETEDFGDEAALTDGDFVLGVRPEFLRLSDSGAIEGEIYSAMPTGMETTVKVRVGSFLLTGVVFGGVLYRIGQKIRLDFQGDGVVLFSRRNGRMIAQGSLSVK